MQKPKIFVALSGGVDSATVAAFLKDQGHDVTGIYMKNWSDEFGIENNCPWEQDVADVEKIAKHLDIPWGVYNFEREYRERVLTYFYDEYRAGRTPNPDILCNNLVKFDLFLNKARENGAEYIATGHYGRIARPGNPFPWESHAKLGLFTAQDDHKDQAYFLQRLSLEQISQATFPLGNLYKSEVRVLANHFNLPVAQKKDSQGICFIGEVDVSDFLKKELQTRSGKIRDIDTNEIVGEHQGLWFYTIGQRQGIGIGGIEKGYYVAKKESSTNTLFVAKGHNHEALLKKEVKIENVLLRDAVEPEQTIYTSLRYREEPKVATILLGKNNTATLHFTDKLAWAPAPGQSAMLLESFTEKPTRPDESDFQEIIAIATKSPNERHVRVLGTGVISD